MMKKDVSHKTEQRRERMKKIVRFLKKEYGEPKTELNFRTNMQCLAAVMLSAQSTDKMVNVVTRALFKKYRTIDDFANADLKTFTKEISSISFFNNKAKHITGAAKIIKKEFRGRIPRTVEELITLPGVAYKTATVVLGELFDIWDGIPTDTHVRRFAIRLNLTDNKDLTKISKDLEALTPKKNWKYVNNGFVLYGRYVCPARPHACEEHALTKIYPKAASVWPRAK
jgi:endonuclease-3